MLIFCCHKCHTKGKFWWKNRPFWEGRKRNKNDFWLAFSMCFLPLSPLFIKIHQKHTVETWFIAHCIYPCDTCDSKKTKTPVLCVCAHARERENIDIFTIQIWGCWFPLHSSVYFHFWTFIENNTLFCEKWAVVLWKTTRHFVENKPSFCESIMHFRTDEIDYLVVLRWKQLNFLWFPRDHLPKTTHSPSFSWKKWPISLAKHLINTLICSTVSPQTEVGVTYVTFFYQCAL